MRRICSNTGLGLFAGPVSGIRIANPAYGPTAPPERVDGSRAHWSRWDTPGRTLYMASNRETALRECLAWARMTSEHQGHIGKLATMLGETPEQIMRDIEGDWRRLGHMQPGHLPAAWRDGHLVYPIKIAEASGWWIDAHAQETLDALSISVGSQLAPLTGRHDVDKGVMFSPDREITTRLSEWMQEQILDDGNEPLGIRFESRVADGTCWAMWMRRADAGLGSDPIEAGPGTEIAPNDPIMEQVTQAYGIRSW